MKISSSLRNTIKRRILEQIKSPESREVVIRTPYKMNEGELDLMKSHFPTLQSARLINEIDDSLIGGMIIVDGSMILDYSIKGKMNEIIGSLLEH